jgi:tetratricopeptide (TPR) repeat protein
LTTRALRAWPLLVAAAGVVSLFLIPRFARSEAREVAGLRRQVESGESELIEDRLREFLVRHPKSPHAVEVQGLIARAILQRARDISDFDRAWEAGTGEIRREIARMLSERGFDREAVNRTTELIRQGGEPEILLDLARALARLERFDEAAARVSEYLRTASPDRRLRGFLTQARIFWNARRYEEMLPLLVEETRSAADKALLQMERGKAFARLGRKAEALAALDEAEELAGDPQTRAMAQLFQAELFARAGARECVEACGRVSASSPALAPLASLILGLYELESRTGKPVETLRTALMEIRRPLLFDETGFDFAGLYASIRKAGEQETDGGRLAGFSDLLREIERLFPRAPGYAIDHARLLLRAGRPGEAADRFLAAEGPEREDALLAAADGCAAGGLPVRAAALYRQRYELRPEANVASLYLQGQILKQAGRIGEALEVFKEYLSRAGPAAPHAASALLARGDMLAQIDRHEEAISEFDRARDMAADPRREEWAQALLGRGRALIEIGRAGDGRVALEEHLERYGATVDAVYSLVRAAIREGEWRAGLDRLAELSRITGADRAVHEDLLREAMFLEGDFHCALGDYPAAIRAYGKAYREHVFSHDRLWGLIGRARALARLDRKQEARRDFEHGRTIFEENLPVYEASLAGRGKEYWTIELDALAKEVR